MQRRLTPPPACHSPPRNKPRHLSPHSPLPFVTLPRDHDPVAGCVDPIVVAAQYITAVQSIVSRNTSPTESVVITFGKIGGGVAPNVIATSVTIMGTVRTTNVAVKRMVRTRLQELATGIAFSHGSMCSIDVKYFDGYPAVVNDERCASTVLTAGKRLLGPRLVGPPTPNMAGEDFSFFLYRKPGAFFFVGSNPDAAFAMDPDMPVRACVRAWCARVPPLPPRSY